jgi:DNA-binding NtrC family response regulator
MTASTLAGLTDSESSSHLGVPDGPAPRVLIIDDDRAICRLLEVRLEPRGFAIQSFTSALEGLDFFEHHEVDVVLTDVRMAEVGGLDLCARMTAARPDIPVVVMTAHPDLPSAISALRAGAHDFLSKPLDIDELAAVLQRAGTRRSIRERLRRLPSARPPSEGSPAPELAGDSDPMRKVLDFIARIAPLDSSVLISGETGTGKELVARALHHASRRREAPFVTLNCSAVPENLLESELFGHVRGAFTDARNARQGLFQTASGGTLFLDEIGEMPVRLQSKLLRAVQERVVRPIGSDKEVPCDVRLLSATNRDIVSAIRDGSFREDLYYRISVFHLLLAHRFIQQVGPAMQKSVAGLDADAADALCAYEWPGNVRELHNVIERAVALACFERVTAADLPDRIRTPIPRRASVPTPIDPLEEGSDGVPLKEVERLHIQRALRSTGGNKTEAARILGMSRRTLYRRLPELGPDVVSDAPPSGSSGRSV